MIPSGVPWLISDKEQMCLSFFSNSYETNILEVVFWFFVCLGYIVSCKRSALCLNTVTGLPKYLNLLH